MTISQQFFSRPVRLLAPMEGLTDPVMRQILTQIAVDVCKKSQSDKQQTLIGDSDEHPQSSHNHKVENQTAVFGYDWSVSEFIRVTHHELPDHVFYKFMPELYNGSKTQAGTPIHAQLLGSNPELMAANACKVATLGSPAVDLNFGCPAKTVNNHRGGSVLLDEPKLLRDIISAVRDAVPSHIPVSAKIRLGYENTDNMNDIRQAIADSGADWLTIHARTKRQGYKPPAYWDKIASFTELPIPVIANGEIWHHEHAVNCSAQAHTPHLMLGRGAVTRPDLIARVDYPQAEITWNELVPHQVQFLEGEFRSERALVGRYKQWLGMLVKGYPEAESLWNVIKREKDRLKIIALLTESTHSRHKCINS